MANFLGITTETKVTKEFIFYQIKYYCKKNNICGFDNFMQLVGDFKYDYKLWSLFGLTKNEKLNKMHIFSNLNKYIINNRYYYDKIILRCNIYRKELTEKLYNPKRIQYLIDNYYQNDKFEDLFDILV
jgi:hypothetical protein